MMLENTKCCPKDSGAVLSNTVYISSRSSQYGWCEGRATIAALRGIPHPMAHSIDNRVCGRLVLKSAGTAGERENDELEEKMLFKKAQNTRRRRARQGLVSENTILSFTQKKKRDQCGSHVYITRLPNSVLLRNGPSPYPISLDNYISNIDNLSNGISSSTIDPKRQTLELEIYLPAVGP